MNRCYHVGFSTQLVWVYVKNIIIKYIKIVKNWSIFAVIFLNDSLFIAVRILHTYAWVNTLKESHWT